MSFSIIFALFALAVGEQYYHGGKDAKAAKKTMEKEDPIHFAQRPETGRQMKLQVDSLGNLEEDEFDSDASSALIQKQRKVSTKVTREDPAPAAAEGDAAAAPAAAEGDAAAAEGDAAAAEKTEATTTAAPKRADRGVSLIASAVSVLVVAVLYS